jgi:magnesium transporter
LVELSDDNAAAILAAMDPEEASQARQLAGYDPETAGGLMITEYLRYDDGQVVQDVLDDLRANADEYADYDVQYAYVVTDSGSLVGVLRLRDLLLSRSRRPIAELMIRQPHAVRVEERLDHLAQFFDRHHFFGVPVVDADSRLVGVIRKSDVEEALAGRADTYSMQLQGIIGGEELRTMPLGTRAGRRLAWLAANVLLNLIAVSVIAVYEETLAAVIALAVFLPLISDMGGNAGVQAIAVSIRELSLGLLKPHELIWVAMKEASVGIINGIALGLLVGVAGWVWQQNAWLGLVVGAAMAINTVIAVIAGGMTPLVLKRFGCDPALAAGPLLTTITDMTGFFLVLSFATALLSQLV